MTGSGTVSDPYIIYDVNDLEAVDDDLDAYYELANNIDATIRSETVGFRPIGQDSPHFTGHFDGRGFTISNLFINRPTEDKVGLFGWTVGGTIQNVIIIDADITGDIDVGGLVGWARTATTITNCSVAGAIEGSWDVGGIVGYLQHGGTMSECRSSGTVISTTDIKLAAIAGGLVGAADGLTISCCYSTANVSAVSSMIGGLIGITFSTTVVTNCYARGNVTSSAEDYVGGLVGWVMEATDTIDNCYSTGVPTGEGEYIGGLIGLNSGTITDCFWDTETSGQATSDGGTGKTTAQMKDKSTFRVAGWDFATIWNICCGVNSSYPCLAGVTPSCSLVGAHHHPTHPTEPNRGKVLSKMGSL